MPLMEQMTGIEPAYSAWEADILPLNYICVFNIIAQPYGFVNRTFYFCGKLFGSARGRRRVVGDADPYIGILRSCGGLHEGGETPLARLHLIRPSGTFPVGGRLWCVRAGRVRGRKTLCWYELLVRAVRIIVCAFTEVANTAKRAQI